MKLFNSLELLYPIFQAPMAGGATTTALVTTVCKHGGLGNIASGYMSTEALNKQMRDVKQILSHNRFGVNVMVPTEPDETIGDLEKAKDVVLEQQKELHKKHDENLLSIETIHFNPLTYSDILQDYEEKISAILDAKPAVVSFVFGVPDRNILQEFKRRGIITIGTATTVEEGIKIEDSGMNAVIAQGFEAGGHRGTFLHKEDDHGSHVGLMPLICGMKDRLTIPIIAAGGISTGKQIAASILLGASAVQLGTAFLVTNESGVSVCYKEAICNSTEDHTCITKVFSGKYARGIKNSFIEALSTPENISSVLDFPLQHQLTSHLRKDASSLENTDYLALWAGQGIRYIKHRSAVEELMNSLSNELNHVLPHWKELL